ncbi:MAG: hypothetical protein J6Y92_10470 [Lentisphaeria bacterium]|nr:hypothetical protein [Lentisphaeria bacterium]
MNQDYYSIGMVLVSLIAIMTLANLAINIWAKTRRRPPIDMTLQDYVRRSDFDKLRDEMRDNDRQIFDLIRSQQARNADAITRLTERLTAWQRGLERQIGRIEGAVGGKGGA